ncbi:MAG: flagellar protein FliS [Lachnospiraceae bacterium]|jgi:flagellar protein FliS|nr:flagellar protein FliS [Lachnospiraceae bacterium]
MKKEKVSEFTRKISQCNKSGLTLITYEILFAYLEEAEEAHREQEHELFRQNIRKVLACLNRLMETLNFDYEISREIYPLYRFCRDEFGMAMAKNDMQNLEVVKRILKNLHEAFLEVSKEDHSRPLMQNSEKVIAGMTYQKNDLTEIYDTDSENRGFFA